MTDKPQLALDQVFRKIEPLTRFSRQSLISESENVRVTRGQAFWTFRIHMSNEKETGTGRLPYRASALESEDKLDQVAQQTVRAAHDAFPNRISAWLSTNAGTDTELHPADCFNGPKCFGHEQTCSNCIGSGWVPCPNSACRGGKVTCPRCDGHGQYECTKCKSLILGSIFGPAVALGLLSWILLLEMRSRTLLATAFDDTEKRMMDGLLGEYWILWKVRGLGFVSSGLPLIISIIALSVLLS